MLTEQVSNFSHFGMAISTFAFSTVFYNDQDVNKSSMTALPDINWSNLTFCRLIADKKRAPRRNTVPYYTLSNLAKYHYLDIVQPRDLLAINRNFNDAINK